MVAEVLQYGEDDIPFSREVPISGEYQSNRTTTVIEHCALMVDENEWSFDVKCRLVTQRKQSTKWRSVKDVCPDAKVKLKHNDIQLTLSSPRDELVFAAFGIPGIHDKKRMQIGFYGLKPLQGTSWKIWAHLFDDTVMAFKSVCQKEEARGHKLLTPLAGLFVSNTDQDIRIDISRLEDGWMINGSSVQTITAREAWDPPRNSTGFPGCVFGIKRGENSDKSFFCEVTVTHGDDTAVTEIVA